MVTHFSHRHPLSPFEVDQDQEDELMCSGCQLEVLPGSSAFKCTKPKCEFLLHKPCSELPRETRHGAHPQHPLTLYPTPPYMFSCDACGGYGTAFVYNCYACRFDLHVQCAALADSVKRDDHQHPLHLVFSLPQRKGKEDEKEDEEDEKEEDNEQEEKEDYLCGVCGSGFIEGYWAYFCKECDYGVHLECATAEADDDDHNNEEEEEEGSKDVDLDSVVAENLKGIAVQQMMLNNQRARMIRKQQATMMNNTRSLFRFHL
ncbi:C1-like DC1 containing protein [Trema orientale]|uniref:C1-like DC1 containing protein n=1 Tax=Trema orientale TaxID=63057 RepID=A0A2P5E6K4_TREOI|nr:C1-like DC1 containing protein [Trema orientale]